jgi:hypothetical protein
MLAFDLETTGLNPREALITCAAVSDPGAGLERVFFFARLKDDRLVPMLDDAEEFMLLLDQADRLCAFNGARFDLPFIEHCLRPGPERVLSWRLKLHDVFEACKLALGVTFTLDALLAHNSIPGKTGSGCNAIQLAEEGRWDALGEYCLNDTRKTHRVSSLQRILLPKTRGIVLDPLGLFTVVGGGPSGPVFS